ncbi:pullulanase [Paenibacillus sp. FSL K6-2524]|uniref:pullulanase n=1 Tax=Paenibacillus sp. FSL K6-2524 TaxID=2954516 RepID=UPI0030F5B17D
MKLNRSCTRIFSVFMIIAMILSCIGLGPIRVNADSDSVSSEGISSSLDVPNGHIRIHYNRANKEIGDLGLWLWGDVTEPSKNWSTDATAFLEGQQDSYGSYLDVPLNEGAKKIGIIVVNRVNGAKEGGDKNVAIASSEMNEVWIKHGSDTVYVYEPVDLPMNTVRIHYDRDDQNYSTYGLWTWGDDVVAPSDGWPAGATAFTPEQVDRYGAYIDVELKEGAKKVNFLVVKRSGEGEKDGGDKSFSLLDRYNHLWIKQGDNNVYVSPYGELPVGLVSAEVLSESKIMLGFTMTDGLEAGSLKDQLSIKDKTGAPISIDSVQITGTTTVEVAAHVVLDNLPLSVTYSGRTIIAGTGWRMLDEMYAYDGDDLGATYNEGKVTFKLWAPTATSVTASVYDKTDDTHYMGSVDLSEGDKGVWSAEVVPGTLDISDFKGYFYQYQVTNDGVTKAVLDPYAKSMAPFRVSTTGKVGSDGDAVGKAAIVDLSTTNPANFDYAQIEGYEQREDAIIWEVHVRDFTSDPSIEGDLSGRWGSYTAFKDKLEYIKSLGVTHIQLMPIMAWYYGDETNMSERELNYSTRDNQYNWGYDPHNYFSPDGAYSEDPSNPELRIKELKEMIQAVHDAGMGVVLDVVYTHMAKADFLNDIVPNYYAWQDANGNNIGGFGNNLATNHKMAEKLMIDSVKYWTEEYKVDGIRWDMMGDATYESIQNAYDEVVEINPNTLFIGEGWRTFSGNIADPSLEGKAADQDWMDKTDSVGVFSDEIRNELKSGYGSEGEPRFITGGARDINVIFNNIKAQPSNTPADDPGDMVSYIEAHDNLTLYDIIAQSIKKDPAIPANDLEIHQRVRLGNMLVLTSQGTAFLHAGQEYGRTKQWKGEGIPEQKYHALTDENDEVFGYFVHDSYDSTDAINMFDWSKATDEVKYPVNQITQKYTAGLIDLRKSTNAFTLGDEELVNSNVTLIKSPEIKASDLVIAYKNTATDGTGNYCVFVNADSTARTLTLSEDLTTGKVLVDNDEAGATGVSEKSGFTLNSHSITLDPLTTVIINKKTSTVDPVTPPSSGSNSTSSGGTSVPPALTSSLQKVLTNLPVDAGKALTAIMDELAKLGAVQGVKAEAVDGKNIAKVDAQKVEQALTNLLKGFEVVQQSLTGQDKLIAAVRSELAIIIDFSAVSGDSVELNFPVSILNKLRSAGASIKLVTADATITLPADFIDAATLVNTKELIITKSLVDEIEARTLTEQVVGANPSLQPRGKVYDFGMFLIDSAGTRTKVTTFNKNVKVSLTLTPQEKAKITDKRKSGVYFVANDGSSEFKGGIFGDQDITFLTQHFSNFMVMESLKTFGDTTGSWARDYIEVLAARGIADGVDSNHFDPQGTVTRGQLSTFLGRVLGLSEEGGVGGFMDVSSSAYYAGYVSAMKRVAIIEGYADGTFQPEKAVTREEMVTLLMRAYSYAIGQSLKEAGSYTGATFNDIQYVSSFAVDSVKAAQGLGIVDGTRDGNFNPKAVATREQMAKVLIRLMEVTGQL